MIVIHNRQSQIADRLIAIASDEKSVEYICRMAREHRSVRLGLMLRDPEHRADRVEELVRYAVQSDLPDTLSLIGNSHRPGGADYLHMTSSQLRDAAALPDRFHSEVPFGASVHSMAEALAACRLGASYLMLSPIFPTASKPGHPGLGVDVLRGICAAVPVPVFALGGIDGSTAPVAIDAGAYGLASISLFTPESQDDLEAVIALIASLRLSAGDD